MVNFYPGKKKEKTKRAKRFQIICNFYVYYATGVSLVISLQYMVIIYDIMICRIIIIILQIKYKCRKTAFVMPWLKENVQILYTNVFSFKCSKHNETH